MKVKLVEYRWTIDTSMDLYARSGDENEVQGAIFIPGDNCPGIIAFMSDKPVFRELSEERPGKSLFPEFSIECKEWDFVETGEMEIDYELAQAARLVARSRNLIYKTNSAFRAIFEKLDDEI